MSGFRPPLIFAIRSNGSSNPDFTRLFLPPNLFPQEAAREGPATRGEVDSGEAPATRVESGSGEAPAVESGSREGEGSSSASTPPLLPRLPQFSGLPGSGEPPRLAQRSSESIPVRIPAFLRGEPTGSGTIPRFPLPTFRRVSSDTPPPPPPPLTSVSLPNLLSSMLDPNSELPNFPSFLSALAGQSGIPPPTSREETDEQLAERLQNEEYLRSVMNDDDTDTEDDMSEESEPVESRGPREEMDDEIRQRFEEANAMAENLLQHLMNSTGVSAAVFMGGPGGTYESLMRLDELFPPVNKSASDETLARLPEIKCAETGKACSICLTDFELNEKCCQLPKCQHIFHSECVKTWLKVNRVCPVCRTEVE